MAADGATDVQAGFAICKKRSRCDQHRIRHYSRGHFDRDRRDCAGDRREPTRRVHHGAEWTYGRLSLPRSGAEGCLPGTGTSAPKRQHSTRRRGGRDRRRPTASAHPAPDDAGFGRGRGGRGVVAEEASSAGASRHTVAGSVEWIVIFDGVARIVVPAGRVAWAVGTGGEVRIVPD